MKAIIKNSLKALALTAMVCNSLTSCKDSFYDSDPLSFYEPTQTFSTESGLESVMAIADRQLKRYWSDGDSDVMLPLMSEYSFSDLMVVAGTD